MKENVHTNGIITLLHYYDVTEDFPQVRFAIPNSHNSRLATAKNLEMEPEEETFCSSEVNEVHSDDEDEHSKPDISRAETINLCEKLIMKANLSVVGLAVSTLGIIEGTRVG